MSSFVRPQPQTATPGIVLAPLSPERLPRNKLRRQSSASTSSLHTSQTAPLDVVYLDDSITPIPPHLKYTAGDDKRQRSASHGRKLSFSAGAAEDGSKAGVEADAAAGGQPQSPALNALQRVSSFNLLQRVASNPKLLLSAASGQEEGLLSAKKDPVAAAKTVQNDAKRKETKPSHKNIQPSWRLRDRMKTNCVGLIMALNVGTDPPDIIKPYPCAKLQCWMDPSSVTRHKAKEKIGERLEAQYAKWQQQRSSRPLKYRRALDPTVEDVRALCFWLRRQARHERVLLHYNGHGVPRPTSSGEIWVFDKNHTEYIPLSVSDLRQWAGTPTICILDCSSAGVLIPFLTSPPAETPVGTPKNLSPAYGSLGNPTMDSSQQSPIPDMDTAASLWVKDMIVLCPTSEDEWLPLHPDYPADIFTSCLTTPIRIALRWFVRNNPASMGSLDPDAVDRIPGSSNDRKTPLGELNWIFTAITDSIAWNVLPKPLFQRLFRQDLLVASMFRNFLLADRILRSLNCTPQSYPPLPPGVADHPLWYAWDLACETCLFALIKEGILANPVSKNQAQEESTNGQPAEAPKQISVVAQTKSTSSPPISSPFFTEQLTAFEVWLDYAVMYKGNTDRLESPEQLPVVLQVLLSQVHRVRALELLRRFLELGPWAVNLSLSLGIFPYVMKLLQSAEYKSVLVNIWASILRFDLSCQVDLVKDNALGHFIQPLANWASTSNQQSTISLPEIAKQRTLAAFCLAATCYRYSQAQKECLRQNLHGACNSLLSAQIKLEEQQRQQVEEEAQNRRSSNDASRFQLLEPIAREWLCLCLGNLVLAYPPSQAEVFNSNVHSSLMSLQQNDEDPNVRAAATYALGCLFEYAPPSLSRASSTNSLTGESASNTPTQTKAANPGAMAQPSPISLGPQAFGNSQPSLQTGRMSQSQSQQPQMFLSQQMPAAAMQMNVPSTGLTGQIQPNVATAMVPGNASGIQLAMAGRPMQGSVGGTMMMSSQNMAVQQSQQQEMHRLGGGYMNQSHSSHMAAQQAVSGLQLSNRQQQLQGGPANYQQRFANPTPGSANLGPMIGTAPVHMMSSPNHLTHPIGMPLMGSPIGSTPVMMQRPGTGFGSPEKQSQMQQPRRRPTVYEDRRRCEFDTKVMDSVIKVLADGSAMVRYEAVMAVSNFIEKYLQAFLAVAEDASRPQDEGIDTVHSDNSIKSDDRPRVVPIPRGVSQQVMERFEKCWKALREIQHHDPQPSVSAAANSIVRVVHETLLDMRMEQEAKLAEKKKVPGLSEIREEGEDGMERAASDIHLSGLSTPESRGVDSNKMPQSDGPQTRLPTVKLYPLRRSASETAGGSFPVTNRGGSPVPPLPLQNPMSRVKAENLLPKSEFYRWKKSIFRPDYDDKEHADAELNDPLNPVGAAQDYRKRRNIRVRETGRILANRFVDLNPRAQPQKKGIDQFLEDDEEEDDERYESLKNELRVKEKKLLKNDPRAGMTSMLKFHSFENALVSCDNRSTISVWDYERGERRLFFRNGNPDGSRMTSAFWINETTTSLFFVGCDDGSARVWSGFLEGNGQVSKESPLLSSAFFAVPNMAPGEKGQSGLVCEWQQATGTLIAGGSSTHLHCWDLASEQCFTTLNIETKACVTSLTTAWDDANPLGSNSNRSMGPDVVVAGHSDGTLKIFDIRMQKAAAAIQGRPKNRKRLTSKLSEHKTWIVDTCFTSYGGRHEIVSGSVAGDIRAWDLRMSQSTRAILAQRSPMTAFSVHRKIPMVATGSHAQFIKLLTLEGEALQVVRFHEELPGHRIGPVSCLEFHKEKMVLAAGSTNSLVGIYKQDPPQRR